MRQALELSTQIAPAAAAMGQNSSLQTQLLNRKLAFSQHFQHLLANGAGGTDDRDIALFSHGITSFI
jgi:dethiobiotin synthetase